MPQPKRLAITIAGAVSLGSYEAGVLYEVVHALGEHNQRHSANIEECVVIDVITGASAGGMTAAIATRKLLFESDLFQGPYNNPFYDVWVKRISLQGLQNVNADEPPLLSLLSSDLIEEISKEQLTAPFVIPTKKHPAAADAISLGVAMTNLNGVDWGRDLENRGEFIFTDHRDQMTRVVNGPAVNWEEIRGAAVACGAFPFAFRAQQLERNVTDYPDPDHELKTNFPGGVNQFVYTDGGVLQNQPLGMAKNLVDDIDHHDDNSNRFYLFVSPHGKGSDACPDFKAADANYFQMLRRLVNTIMQQSTFQDWLTAEDMNKKISFARLRAKSLQELLNEGGLDTNALGQTATSLLAAFSESPELQSEQKQWTRSKYADLVAALPAAAQQPFVDSMLAFEKCAGLSDHDYMQIYGVTANDCQLAGAGIFAFLGFFDERFRVHDYDRGRKNAIEALQAITSPGRIDFTPETPLPDPDALDPVLNINLNGIGLNEVPAGDVQGFKKGLEDRIYQMLELWGHGQAAGLYFPMHGMVNLGVNHLFSEPRKCTGA